MCVCCVCVLCVSAVCVCCVCLLPGLCWSAGPFSVFNDVTERIRAAVAASKHALRGWGRSEARGRPAQVRLRSYAS